MVSQKVEHPFPFARLPTPRIEPVPSSLIRLAALRARHKPTCAPRLDQNLKILNQAPPPHSYVKLSELCKHLEFYSLNQKRLVTFLFLDLTPPSNCISGILLNQLTCSLLFQNACASLIFKELMHVTSSYFETNLFTWLLCYKQLKALNYFNYQTD